MDKVPYYRSSYPVHEEGLHKSLFGIGHISKNPKGKTKWFHIIETTMLLSQTSRVVYINSQYPLCFVWTHSQYSIIYHLRKTSVHQLKRFSVFSITYKSQKTSWKTPNNSVNVETRQSLNPNQSIQSIWIFLFP